MTVSPPASPPPGAVFDAKLLDPSGQPNVVVGGTLPSELIWTLINNLTGATNDLVITPFTSGTVGPSQYHFLFAFAPGALTAAPTAAGWAVAVELDTKGAIISLYLAWTGTTPLDIPAGQSHATTLVYTTAVQENAGDTSTTVTSTAGTNVTLGGQSIEGKSYGPFDLKLVPPGVPSLSVPPIAVDFVGRRSVLNDGATSNTVTFALTNLTTQDIALTPTGGTDAATVFTAWFDVSPNNPQVPYPWALTEVQYVDPGKVKIAPPSSDWACNGLASLPSPNGGRQQLVPGNTEWSITVTDAVSLAPQDPVLFKVTGIVSTLDPGVTRMYLKFENLPGYADGILMAELEKSPLSYGPARGQGMYLSIGQYSGSTPPAAQYDQGLYVQQNGHAPALTLSGGAGLTIENTQQVGAQIAGDVRVRGAFEVDQATGNGVVRFDTHGLVVDLGPQAQHGMDVRGGTNDPLLSIEQNGQGPVLRTKGLAQLDQLEVDGTVSAKNTVTLGATTASELTVTDRVTSNYATVENTATITKLAIGNWVLSQDQVKGWLRFDDQQGHVITFGPGGVFFNEDKCIQHGDPMRIMQSDSGAYLNGTSHHGDGDHPAGWHAWTYWMNNPDGDSNLNIYYNG